MRVIHAVALAGTLCATSTASAVVIGFDASASWNGFMNVFDSPANGGGYIFSSGWGIADLRADVNVPSNTVTLSPNTIGDPDPFWYVGGGGPGALGNKSMEANLYVESNGGALGGQAVTFEGTVLSNSFTNAHVARIFIRDFAPDFSSSVDVFLPVTPGPFSLTLNTINDPARHVQYGFQVRGQNVWFTDTAPFGFAVIGAAVPAPGALSLLGLGGLLAARRRR